MNKLCVGINGQFAKRYPTALFTKRNENLGQTELLLHYKRAKIGVQNSMETDKWLPSAKRRRRMGGYCLIGLWLPSGV
jgi:hypothetical protein